MWHGAVNEHGYGRFWDGRTMASAHRYAYRLVIGEIPDGLELHHQCETPLCVNPSHLEPMTQRDNNRISNSITAINARKTHCKHGHEFTPENTLLKRRGDGARRQCRACHRESVRRYRNATERSREDVRS